MSLEALQKVTGAEQEAQTRKTEAAAAAKKMVSDAQRVGEALLERARQEAEEDNKALLRQAEQRAQEAAQRLLEDAKAQADAMSKTAEGRLDAAADLIVRRVVNR